MQLFTKVYEKVKKFIKQNYKILLFFLVSYILLTFPVPYYIYTTGGTIDINDRVEIKDAYTQKGSFNFAYVTELKGTLPTYLLSYLIPSWDRVKTEEYKMNENETEEDLAFRDHFYLDQANQSAIQVAYQAAGREFHISARHLYVLYLSEESKTNLKVGDEILTVDGKTISSLKEYQDIVLSHSFQDRLVLRVKRKEKEIDAWIEVQNLSGKKLTGISLAFKYEYQTNPELTLKFSANESGPSGGLMLTLSIYNKLVKEDITKGRKIVGTGTIDEEGNVGAIGGVSYKLRGAVKEKADLFFVPNGENYKECMNLKEKNNYSITIVGVDTFQEALDYLLQSK